MTPLPSMPFVIDLPHRIPSTDWLDIYCSAECRFFISSASGPNGAASPWGRPNIWTNIVGTDFYPYGGEDLFLPKLQYSERDGRLQTFAEALSPPFTSCVNMHVYAREKVRVLENTPEEIQGAAIEMMDRMDGKSLYSERDEILQARFRREALLRSVSGVMNCRVARDFLRAHSELLPA